MNNNFQTHINTPVGAKIHAYSAFYYS